MKHIDEGTIHAWLDGALDAARAAEVELHVAGCDECGAKVAEARGLIAGASRILTALDDVPGGVLPARATATPARQVVRRWRVAPWATGIAAALVLAVGIYTANRDPKVAFAPADSVRRLDLGESRDVAQPVGPLDSTAFAVRPGAGSLVNAPAPRVARAASPSAAAPQRTIGPLRAAGEATGGGAAVPAVAASADVVTLDTLPQEKRAVSADALQPRVALAPPARTAMEIAIARRDVPDLAGCYQTAVPVEERRAVAAAFSQVTAAAEAARNRAAGAAAAKTSAPTAAIAPSAAAARSDVGVMPSLVRLDTTRVAQGAIVRSVTSAEPIGRWFIVGTGDSVRITVPAGTVTVPATNRVVCPGDPRP